MLCKKSFTLILVMVAFLIAGCSSGGGVDVTVPGKTTDASPAAASHQSWGLWQFVADPAAGSLDVVQLRTGNFHLNTRVFLEPPALVYLTLESLEFNGNIIEVDIGLRHPFLGLTEFTGFDVCGMLISNGSYSGFDDSALRYAGPGDTYLVNPDGHSRWWNPVEFPHNATAFAYNDGLLGTPDSVADFNSTLNAYKYFCDVLDDPDGPLTDVTQESRGMFSAGQKNIRHYTIELGEDGLIFNYAVDASWTFPQGDPPWTAPDDFAASANRVEPWFINVSEAANSLYYFEGAGGGGIELSIDVYDWFGIETDSVYVESANGVIPQAGPFAPTGGGEGYSTYEVDIADASPAASGPLGILITVETEDEGFQDFLPGNTTSAYYVYTTTVSDAPSNHTVTGIEPAYGSLDQDVTGAKVYGTNFADGPSLGVRITKTGQSDMVATNTAWQDDSTITCDFHIPSDAALGLWDVEVINGTGGNATGIELFEVFDCGSFSAISSSSVIYAEWFNSREGAACTRLGTSYVVCGYGQPASHPPLLCAENASTGSGYNYVDFMSDTLPAGYQVNDIVSDSQNIIYLAADSDLSILREIPFDTSTGFGSVTDFGSITAGWSIYRITVDPDDDPVILAYNNSDASQMRVFHWNGTGWDETDVPPGVVNGNYAQVRDFDYNPVLIHYAFVCLISNVTNLYAIDMSGSLVHTENDVFSYNIDLVWDPGIYIDQTDPTCHVAVWGGSAYSATPIARPIVLFDAAYNILSQGNGSADNQRLTLGPRGALAPGTNRLFTGGSSLNVFMTRYFVLPPEW